MKKIISIRFLSILSFFFTTVVFSYLCISLGDYNTAVSSGLALFLASFPIPAFVGHCVIASRIRAAARKLGFVSISSERFLFLANITALAMTKRGILTDGQLQLTDIVPRGITIPSLLTAAATAEQISNHPVAKTICAAAEARLLPLQRLATSNEVSGSGVEALWNNSSLRVGNSQWLKAEGATVTTDLLLKADQLACHGKTVVIVCIANSGRGILAMDDSLAPENVATIRRLQNLTLNVVLLTGDSTKSTKILKNFATFDKIHAESTPADKLRELQLLQSKGNVVAFLGDPTQDLSVWEASDFRITVARLIPPQKDENASDISVPFFPPDLILPNGLSDLPELVSFARLLYTRCRQNTWISFFFALVMILSSIGVFADWIPISATPQFIFVGVCIVLLVITWNALRR